MSNLFPMLIIFSYSLIMNSVAPALKLFQSDYSISVGISSLIPLFSLVGTVLSNIFVGIYLNKLGLKRALLIGFGITIFGSLIIAFSNTLALSLLGMLIFGFSSGFGFNSSTMLLAQNKNANFGFFHGAYGLGGILAPLFIQLAQSRMNNFKNVYFIYATIFILLFAYTSTRLHITTSTKAEAFKLSEIKYAFSNSTFMIFLTLLILYSSAEIGTINWAGNIMKEGIVTSATAYSLFWILFTLGRFFLSPITKLFKDLVSVNTIAMIILVSLFVITKNPLFFIIAGLFFGPLFPYIQQTAVGKIEKSHLPLFNGATYAFTSLGGSIVSTIMGAFLDTVPIISYLLPIIVILAIFLLNRKVEN